MKRKAVAFIAALLLIAIALSLAKINVSADNQYTVQSETYPMKYENADGSTVIEITLERHYDTNCFVARIVTCNPKLLSACFANDRFDRVGVMTEVAKDHDAVFMVNADWSTGELCNNFVVRNGDIYRYDKTEWAGASYFCVMTDGHLKFIRSHTPVREAIKAGVYHSFSFWGSNLFKHGKPRGTASRLAPRTFMGEVQRDDDMLEYIIVVADGRSHESKGLNHSQEAKILYRHGCNIGYNLDGGGSSEMVFDGKILNVPSDGHERRDHDFIYVRYGD